jgi:hypothetical protein
MADGTPDTTTPKGGGKIARFIRKNKALSAVIGIAGVWFGWHELHKNSGGGEEGAEVVPGTYEGPVPRTSELSHEGVDEEINRVGEELGEERRDREEMEREREESHVESEGPSNPDVGGGNGPTEREPGELEGPTTEVGGGRSVSIHGRTFNGATSYHIAKTGQTEGGKKYIEYAIQFPGRIEHWQYFTASGNWREVNNSATGGGQNKPPAKGGGGGGGKPAPGGPVKSPSPGGGGGGPKPTGTPNPNHPGAISTGNACVNGGVGAHKAPSGYHLFCENGTIWRAKNQEGVSPGKPVGSPPPPPPSPSPQPGGGGGGGIDGHPNAVKTANQCVNGGVGPHTAPPGFHLFCASDGWIWRAPNGG